MSEAAIKEGEAINYVLEGIDPAVKEGVLTAIEFYGKEKSENGNKIEDVIKVNKLRTAFNTLVSALITTRMNDLNKQQRLFLCSGAIGDVVEINGNKINLLDSGLYAELLEKFEKRDDLSPFSNFIYSTLDKMRALAEGKLEIIDTSGKKKRKKTEDIRDPKKVKAELEWKRNDALKAGANLIRTLGSNVDKMMQLDATKLKTLKLNYDALDKYFALLAKGERIAPDEKKLRDALAMRSDGMTKLLADFSKLYAEAFTRSVEGIEGIKAKIDDLKDIDSDLSRVLDVVADSESRVFDTYKADHIEILKKDISIINSFIVSASEKASNRVPYSGARILLNSQIPDMATAMTNYFCTPSNVIESFKKVLGIHINAFPLDEDGNFIIPPILIEPIRNYVDFLEDRFIMGFISGEAGKKGAYVTFTPIDYQVMKAVGMYLAKDPVYDYRGEINEGTFMGDYTGKIEKTAQVKWTGQDKKMNMVMSAELVDAASRDDAVQDYTDFVFNALNGLGPPPKMSKRKINVLLRYATIKSLDNNVRLLLTYCAQSEPTEVRDTILKYTNRNYDVAKEMVRKVVKEDPMVQRTLGNNPEMVIAKIFV
jgi:hypothetical protein